MGHTAVCGTEETWWSVAKESRCGRASAKQDDREVRNRSIDCDHYDFFLIKNLRND